MDNVSLYGSDIPFPSMQELVTVGLMPDYRLTLTYRNHEETLKTVSEEMKNSKKIIICLQSLEAIEAIRAYLESFEKNIFVVHGGMPSEQITANISNFSSCITERSWLLTCLVLLEGADIPIADTVVLLAPWKTETRLIQLLLRPGRWYPKKNSFNIVAPSDDGRFIENNLRIAGFDVAPSKTRHLRTATQAVATSSADIVRTSGHIWCVSYTTKNTIEGGMTPVTADFNNAIARSQISAAQLGLDKAKAGDMVIFRGPTNVAIASVLAVRVTADVLPDGKTKKRTVIDVNYLPVRWEPRVTSGAPRARAGDTRSILLTVTQYRECIVEMWNGREDMNWICNPRFTGGFRYDTERRALIERVIDPQH
jgi:hypothetical protein